MKFIKLTPYWRGEETVYLNIDDIIGIKQREKDYQAYGESKRDIRTCNVMTKRQHGQEYLVIEEADDIMKTIELAIKSNTKFKIFEVKK